MSYMTSSEPVREAVPAALSITLFGAMQVRVHGRPLPPLRSRKPLWLLALLSLRPNRLVEREWLAGMLWPDSEETQALQNLRPILSDLRSALATQGKRLQSPVRHALVLDLTDAEVDVLAFDAALTRGTLADLEQAVALYRGPLLEGCNEEWVPQERAAREQLYVQAVKTLADAALAGGDFDAAAGDYQRAVRTDPWQEAARRGWMEALAKNGDTNTALHVYRELVHLLRSDPTATPDQATCALYQRLRAEARQRASTPAHAAVAAETVATPVVHGSLPHPLTKLVGREDERLEVGMCLRHSRLVTLNGPGGIGKTRLAREVAYEIVGEYPDGVWLVALESLSEGSRAIQQVASVLGLREEQGRTPLQRVTEHLRNKRLLLVLDNCEHLLEASAQVAGHLLQECGQVRILATSREPLGILGETVWRVPTLATPDLEHLPQGQASLVQVLQSYESVKLFVERAQAIQMSFALNEKNARIVAQVCQCLEGIPLAIELAAVRVRAMSVAQIAARLGDHLGHLGLLTGVAGGSRPAHSQQQSRQQTLRATLDWSYELLTEAERTLLRRLSVFAGGCSLEAAEQICAGEGIETGQVLDLLASLVDKSLILFEERELAGGRYRLLEMVRQYAAEGLAASGEAEQIKTRHRDWFLDLAEAVEPQLKGAEQGYWLERLETEHANLRTALAFSETDAQGARAGLRLAGALGPFWQLRGYLSEGRTSLAVALEGAKHVDTLSIRAKALRRAGALALSQRDYGATRAYYEECLTIYRQVEDPEGLAMALNGLGELAQEQSDFLAARRLHEESLAIRRQLGDPVGIALALNPLGNLALEQGDLATAKARFEESQSISAPMGDKLGTYTSRQLLGVVAEHQGDLELARTFYAECLPIWRELRLSMQVAWGLHGLGFVASQLGDFTAAHPLLTESLQMFQEMEDTQGLDLTLQRLGGLAVAEGQMQRAARLLAAGAEQRAATGSELAPATQQVIDQDVAAVRAGLGAEAFEAAWATGIGMTLEQAIAYALEPDEPSSTTQEDDTMT
jgi:predicted ATPase/DNA-binding SARP family transcriptional activator